MSLVILVKAGNEGFAWSDGAVSTEEPKMVRRDVPKIMTLPSGLVIAWAGCGDATEILHSRARELPANTDFAEARVFLRNELSEYNRIHEPRIPGAGDPRNLAAALLGDDGSGNLRIIAWDGHNGTELNHIEQGQDDPDFLHFALALNKDALYFGVTHVRFAFKRYLQDPDLGKLIKGVRGAFENVAAMFPEQLGGEFYWARVGLKPCLPCSNLPPCGNSAFDLDGNLTFKNIKIVEGATVSPSTTSISFVAMPDMTVTITTHGYSVRIMFNGICYNSTAGQGGAFALWRDGSALANVAGGSFISSAANDEHGCSLSFTDYAPSAASHTYEIYWEATGGTLNAVGTVRFLQVEEYA
jgi:hypothetical protein